MKKRLVIGLLAAIFFLFLVLNRGAYQGFFQDDELGNLSWAPNAAASTWITGMLTPAFLPTNFRPAGHFYFFLLGHAAKLNYPVYVAVLQAIHLLNAMLVWRLARQLSVNWWASISAAAFFALNLAAFDAFWKPMYIFDVLCAAFALSSLLFYLQKRWLLCFLCFWIAYKSKELAVMLPAVFYAYEFLLGKREWKRPLPFLLVSLSFGAQAILLSPHKGDAYTLRFTTHALIRTIPFYLERCAVPPWTGVGLLFIPFLTRDRRVWFGLIMAFLLAFPLFFLPGRLFSAYVYLPQAGAALAVAAFASQFHPAWVVAAIALWMPFNYRSLVAQRRATLAAAQEASAYFHDLVAFAHLHPNPAPLVFENLPLGYHEWGVVAAARLAWQKPELSPRWIQDPVGRQILASDRYVLMGWNAPTRKLYFVERP